MNGGNERFSLNVKSKKMKSHFGDAAARGEWESKAVIELPPIITKKDVSAYLDYIRDN
tara:strand:+ start:806 stop:979 length:174 start_codon:yes stop_codon:yes gene_type:complete